MCFDPFDFYLTYFKEFEHEYSIIDINNLYLL